MHIVTSDAHWLVLLLAHAGYCK